MRRCRAERSGSSVFLDAQRQWHRRLWPGTGAPPQPLAGPEGRASGWTPGAAVCRTGCCARGHSDHAGAPSSWSAPRG
eukprot:scaffold39258_cov67-Phaeocystis_antarctica.AAC.8